MIEPDRQASRARTKKNGALIVTAEILMALFAVASVGITLYLLLGMRKHPHSHYYRVDTPVVSATNNDYDDLLSDIPGRIPILMYHNIRTSRVEKKIPKAIKRSPRYFVSPEQFRGQLEALHAANFRNISLDEYLSLMRGEKKHLSRIPPNCKLYVLTFDDASYGQFDILGVDGDDNPIIDPECAVGVMVDFARAHPEFKLNAAFCVDFSNIPFNQKEYVRKKLNLLLDYGFEIVNHTATHKNLSRLVFVKPEWVEKEIGEAMEKFESIIGYRVATINKIAYPGGRENPRVWKLVENIHYKDKNYIFRAALDAEGYQAINPNSRNFNPYNIARIEINSKSFEEQVLNAPGLYKTPPQDKIKYISGDEKRISLKQKNITEKIP